MESQICYKCHISKPHTEFHPNNVWCKSCVLLKQINSSKQRDDRLEYKKENDRKAYDMGIQKKLLHDAKKRAKEKGLECTIVESDIEIVDHCPILDVELRPNTGVFGHDSHSLDRVDSSLGYIPGNVRVISWRANFLKSNLNVEQVEKLLEYMKGQ